MKKQNFKEFIKECIIDKEKKAIVFFVVVILIFIIGLPFAFIRIDLQRTNDNYYTPSYNNEEAQNYKEFQINGFIKIFD